MTLESCFAQRKGYIGERKGQVLGEGGQQGAKGTSKPSGREGSQAGSEDGAKTRIPELGMSRGEAVPGAPEGESG